MLTAAGALPSAWAVAGAAAPPDWAPPVEAAAALSGADPPCGADAPTATGVLPGKPSRSHPPRPGHGAALLVPHNTAYFQQPPWPLAYERCPRQISLGCEVAGLTGSLTNTAAQEEVQHARPQHAATCVAVAKERLLVLV